MKIKEFIHFIELAHPLACFFSTQATSRKNSPRRPAVSCLRGEFFSVGKSLFAVGHFTAVGTFELSLGQGVGPAM